jgi:hypothetical protein
LLIYLLKHPALACICRGGVLGQGLKNHARLLFLTLPLLLAACADGSVRDTLGLNRDAPDEFTVVSRPPLSVPPEFTLRPPQPGAPALGPSADEKARGVLLGQPAATLPDVNRLTEPTVATAVTPVIETDAPTAGDMALLKHAGADSAMDDIREKLAVDAQTPADTSHAKTLYDKLTGASKDEPVVDAPKEAERLRTDKDEGKPATAGDVPVEETKPKSVLDSIF